MDNANIKFNIKQTADGVTDTSELFTKGEFREKDGSFFVDYDESAATGYEGSHVQLRIAPDIVVMTRTGSAFTSFMFEKGKRHFCHYGTEYGSCMVGISTTQLECSLNEKGGSVKLSYSIDVNSGLMTENEITLNIRTQ